MNERISIIKHRSQICSTPQNLSLRASLVVQWLRFWAPNAGGMGLSLGQGTKIPQATTKTQHSQIKKQILFLKRVTRKY